MEDHSCTRCQLLAHNFVEMCKKDIKYKLVARKSKNFDVCPLLKIKTGVDKS